MGKSEGNTVWVLLLLMTATCAGLIRGLMGAKDGNMEVHMDRIFVENTTTTYFNYIAFYRNSILLTAIYNELEIPRPVDSARSFRHSVFCLRSLSQPPLDTM